MNASKPRMLASLLVGTLALPAACSDSASGTAPPAAQDASTDAKPPRFDVVEVGLDAPDVALDVIDVAKPRDVVDVTDVAKPLDIFDAAPDTGPADVPPTPCTSDTDCASRGGGVCDTTSGRCVTCTSSNDTCRADQHCDPMTFECVPGCRADEGCASTDGGRPRASRCDTAAHTCVECVRDDQCPMAANARVACVMNACALTCDATFGDCDGDTANGCETRTDRTVAHCGACGRACSGAGSACVEGMCTEDCRVSMSLPCATGTVCDYLTGRCLDPSMACILTGMATACGAGASAQQCGPGSRCNTAMGACEAATECRRVVCDATGLCRGADCTLAGGGVTDLTLDPPTVGVAGASGGLRLGARVTAAGLCGLNVSFEVRRDGGFYVSAGNDMGIWRVTPGTPPRLYVNAMAQVSGVTADRAGSLYYVLTRAGAIRRVREVGGMPVDELYAMLPAAPSGRGISRLTFGPDGQLYVANRNVIARVSATGTVTDVVTIGSENITGLAFDNDGALVASAILPNVYRVAPGATTATLFYTVASINPGDFFHEALVLGPDGALYGSSFPNNTQMGLIYRLDAMNVPRRFVGFAEMNADVPAVRYAGVHGMAFGADGTLYFINQNTNGNTREASGQLLARRPTGRVELIASGFNLDWTDGFDGDLVLTLVTANSATGAVRAGGAVGVTLDVPSAPGVYEVRALITDPRDGSIREARQTFTVM
jgi:hypothetical protein